MIAPDPDRAVYRQLAALLRERIDDGTYRPGQRMPSEKDLHDEFGFARETVRRALAVLREEGVIEVRHGYGTFVAERPVTVEIGRGDTVTAIGGRLRVDRADGSTETYPAGTRVITRKR